MPDRSKAYTDAGVNLAAANSLVDRIKTLVKATHTPGVVSDIGGFGGLFRPEVAGMKEPILVSGTDGVGTKVKLAVEFGIHDTIGIDLVAMSINDILVQGAVPLFFLDYFATGKLDVDKAEDVIRGVAEGCKQAGCALLGGETAEMPDMYADGEYDLAGFGVGLADAADIVDGSTVAPGDVLVGLGSSGVHSNGFSLVRKLAAGERLRGEETFPGTDASVAEVLLAPTVIYARAVSAVMADYRVKGMVHITGGGFYDNIPRVLPENVEAVVDFAAWKDDGLPPVFPWLRKTAAITWPEMLQIFNCGIGYLFIVNAGDAQGVAECAHKAGYRAWNIGHIRERTTADSEQVVITGLD